jgi:peroxiredoxin Q/BCP
MFGLLPKSYHVTDKKWRVQNDFDSMLATKHIPKALEAIKKLV